MKRAILAVGKYYCFIKGNYDKGLPLLAKCTNAELKDLAVRDLAGPKEPRKQMDLADDWYQTGRKRKGLAQRQTFRRAFYWYQASLAKLEGLTRSTSANRSRSWRELFPTGSSAPPSGGEITAELRKIDRGPQRCRACRDDQ